MKISFDKVLQVRLSKCGNIQLICQNSHHYMKSLLLSRLCFGPLIGVAIVEESYPFRHFCFSVPTPETAAEPERATARLTDGLIGLTERVLLSLEGLEGKMHRWSMVFLCHSKRLERNITSESSNTETEKRHLSNVLHSAGHGQWDVTVSALLPSLPLCCQQKTVTRFMGLRGAGPHCIPTARRISFKFCIRPLAFPQESRKLARGGVGCRGGD